VFYKEHSNVNASDDVIDMAMARKNPLALCSARDHSRRKALAKTCVMTREKERAQHDIALPTVTGLTEQQRT